MQIEASSEGVAAVAKLVRRVVDCWLAHAIDREAPAPLSEGDAAALEATGRRLLNYVRLDPDNKVPFGLTGSSCTSLRFLVVFHMLQGSEQWGGKG